MVPGLLTASMVTELGGRLKLLAHTMSFTVHDPVYTDERLRCTMTIESIDEQDGRCFLNCSANWTRDNERVVEATVKGILEQSGEYGK